MYKLLAIHNISELKSLANNAKIRSLLKFLFIRYLLDFGLDLSVLPWVLLMRSGTVLPSLPRLGIVSSKSLLMEEYPFSPWGSESRKWLIFQRLNNIIMFMLYSTTRNNHLFTLYIHKWKWTERMFKKKLKNILCKLVYHFKYFLWCKSYLQRERDKQHTIVCNLSS